MAKRITAGHSKYAQLYGRLPSGEYIYVQPNGEPLLDQHGLTEMVGDMNTLGAIAEMLTAEVEQLRADSTSSTSPIQIAWEAWCAAADDEDAGTCPPSGLRGTFETWWQSRQQGNAETGEVKHLRAALKEALDIAAYEASETRGKPEHLTRIAELRKLVKP